jgi:hypothetical protein
MQAECGDTDLFDVSSSAAPKRFNHYVGTARPMARRGGSQMSLLEQVASGAPVMPPAGPALAQSVQW